MFYRSRRAENRCDPPASGVIAWADRPLFAALVGVVFDGDEVFAQGDQDGFAGFALADVAHDDGDE